MRQTHTVRYLEATVWQLRIRCNSEGPGVPRRPSLLYDSTKRVGHAFKGLRKYRLPRQTVNVR